MFLAYHGLFLCLGSVLSFGLYGPLLCVESTVHFLSCLKYLDGFKAQFVLAMKPGMLGVIWFCLRLYCQMLAMIFA